MKRVAQRIFDVTLALILLVPVSLGIIFFALLILLVDNYSPLFIQERLGLHGRIFRCIKLQTRRPPGPDDEMANKEHDARRDTRVGLFLQDHGFDELPQLLNVIFGQMRFVGPRPYLDKKKADILKINPGMTAEINLWWQKRQMVKPGLSGWHQIHSPGPKIIKYDLEYLNNPNFRKRVRIFVTSSYILIIGKKRYFRNKVF